MWRQAAAAEARGVMEIAAGGMRRRCPTGRPGRAEPARARRHLTGRPAVSREAHREMPKEAVAALRQARHGGGAMVGEEEEEEEEERRRGRGGGAATAAAPRADGTRGRGGASTGELRPDGSRWRRWRLSPVGADVKGDHGAGALGAERGRTRSVQGGGGDVALVPHLFAGRELLVRGLRQRAVLHALLA